MRASMTCRRETTLCSVSISGPYAEYVVAPAENLMPSNPTSPLVEARVARYVMLQGMTAILPDAQHLPRYGRPDEALVHAAAGVPACCSSSSRSCAATVTGTTGTRYSFSRQGRRGPTRPSSTPSRTSWKRRTVSHRRRRRPRRLRLVGKERSTAAPTSAPTWLHGALRGIQRSCAPVQPPDLNLERRPLPHPPRPRPVHGDPRGPCGAPESLFSSGSDRNNPYRPYRPPMSSPTRSRPTAILEGRKTTGK